ncbi:MAG: glycerophosphodiester phosphodiesterase [Phycisphaerae bacterium]
MKNRGMIAIAHRGASAWAPENTVAAFDAALEVGCRAVEFDVRLTADGVPVVIHDETLERTTNGRGRVAETNWLDILRLDAGSWKHPRFAGSRVPSLEEALQAISPCAQPVIEIKVPISPSMVVDLLTRYDILTDAVVMSFDENILASLRAENRKVVLFQLLDRWSPKVIRSCRSAGITGVVMKFDQWALDRAMMAKELMPHVWAYDVNDPGAAAACGAMGLDGVITDFPDIVRARAEA